MAEKYHIVKLKNFPWTGYELPKGTKNSGIIFDVSTKDGKLGTITLTAGRFRWTPKNQQKAKALSWSEFAEMMNKLS